MTTKTVDRSLPVRGTADCSLHDGHPNALGMSVPAFMRILPVVDNALASASEQELADLGLPSGWHRSQAKDFRIEPERGGVLRMTWPQGLIHRRWLLTAAGHVRRWPTGVRRILQTLPDRTVKAHSCSWFTAWSTGLPDCRTTGLLDYWTTGVDQPGGRRPS